jgi:hypothetical protein
MFSVGAAGVNNKSAVVATQRGNRQTDVDVRARRSSCCACGEQAYQFCFVLCILLTFSSYVFHLYYTTVNTNTELLSIYDLRYEALTLWRCEQDRLHSLDTCSMSPPETIELTYNPVVRAVW